MFYCQSVVISDRVCNIFFFFGEESAGLSGGITDEMVINFFLRSELENKL